MPITYLCISGFIVKQDESILLCVHWTKKTAIPQLHL